MDRTKNNNFQNRRLTRDEIGDICSLYEDYGWKLLWIAKKHNINHLTIINLIKKFRLLREIPVLDKKPEEVKALYRRRAQDTYDDDDELEDDFEEDPTSQIKSYQEILKDAKTKRNESDSECSHPYWVKRCSMCNTILESDSQENCTSSVEPVKLIYNEFDKLVCSYDVALDLQRLGVKQHSLLYWIFYENKNVISLRVRANIPDATNENALLASAFTSQELFELLSKVNASLRNASFMNKLALNGNNPTYLAKLLCRSLRKTERTKSRRTKHTSITDENSI